MPLDFLYFKIIFPTYTVERLKRLAVALIPFDVVIKYLIIS